MENKIRVNVYLSQEAINLLDKTTKEQDLSRSALVQKLALELKHKNHTNMKLNRLALVEELDILFEKIKELEDNKGHNSSTKEMRRIAKEEISNTFPDSY